MPYCNSVRICLVKMTAQIYKKYDINLFSHRLTKVKSVRFYKCRAICAGGVCGVRRRFSAVMNVVS